MLLGLEVPKPKFPDESMRRRSVNELPEVKAKPPEAALIEPTLTWSLANLSISPSLVFLFKIPTTTLSSVQLNLPVLKCTNPYWSNEVVVVPIKTLPLESMRIRSTALVLNIVLLFAAL